MSIFFHSEDRDIPEIEKEKVIDAIISICALKNKKVGDINFIYCSDEFLLKMNKQYLKHDYYTDIITFNYNEGKFVSGDVFMSRDRIEENAKKFNENSRREFIRLCGHGILHLLGQDDSTDEEKEKMRQKEDEFIEIVQES